MTLNPTTDRFSVTELEMQRLLGTCPDLCKKRENNFLEVMVMKIFPKFLMALCLTLVAAVIVCAEEPPRSLIAQHNVTAAKLALAFASFLTHSAQCDPTDTTFLLGAPENKATDQSLELTLAWTEPCKPVSKYVVYVSESSSFGALLIPLSESEVSPSTSISGGEFSIKKGHKLRPGTTYFWKVKAVFTDGTEAFAQNGVFRFTTTSNFFGSFAKKGFRLRKALSGPDAGELAEFSFLNTIGQKTVYSTTFAFSWQSINRQRARAQDGDAMPNNRHTFVEWGASVEGSLASDESEAEDAWRFRGSAILTTDFTRCLVSIRPCPPNQLSRPTINSLITYISVKLEGDRDFDVRKLSAEFKFTPNSRKLAIGTARPELPSHPFQFQWRPFFQIDVGHTFRRGVSAETEDTILRLVPRVRARLDLNFLRQMLNMNSVAIFADDTFYYLPLENSKRHNNFFMSGIEFNFTPNLGFGLTYKNGRSAPKFQSINTLQGVLGIRF